MCESFFPHEIDDLQDLMLKIESETKEFSLDESLKQTLIILSNKYGVCINEERKELSNLYLETIINLTI